jgi:hypothetical protein
MFIKMRLNGSRSIVRLGETLSIHFLSKPKKNAVSLRNFVIVLREVCR